MFRKIVIKAKDITVNISNGMISVIDA